MDPYREVEQTKNLKVRTLPIGATSTLEDLLRRTQESEISKIYKKQKHSNSSNLKQVDTLEPIKLKKKKKKKKTIVEI